jgi:nicotinate-nucleotide adenylyltransferase
LPAAVPPHKAERDLAPAARRIEMLELAVAGNAALSVCRHETDRGGLNYTVDTLAHFLEEEPSRELFFLLGADMLCDLPQWRDAARVCELAIPVAVARAGFDVIDYDGLRDIATADRIDVMRRHHVQMPRIEISATDLRQRVAAGRSIRYQVPRAIEMYIEMHSLYRMDRG